MIQDVKELQPLEEIVSMASRARKIYDDEIVDQLTDADYDKNVAIDVESGDWEVGGLNDSMERLESRRPNATIYNIYHEAPFAERFSRSTTHPIG